MHQRLIPQSVLLLLAALAIMLVIGVALLLSVARVLAAMGDAQGALVLDYLSLGCGILFVFDLILLVFALAVHALGEPDERTDIKGGGPAEK